MGHSRRHGWSRAAATLASAAAAWPFLLPCAAGLRMRALRVHAKAWFLFALTLCALGANAALPPNTTIANTATATSAGVFIGYIQSASGAAQPGNCTLETGGKHFLTATYLDASENNAAVSAGAQIDPFGIVFDSSSGAPVIGARVTVIDLATGL